MNKAGITDPFDIDKIRDLGVIDLPTIQKKLNMHYTLRLTCLAGDFDQCGERLQLWHQGPLHGAKIDDDHQLGSDTYPVLRSVDGK